MYKVFYKDDIISINSEKELREFSIIINIMHHIPTTTMPVLIYNCGDGIRAIIDVRLFKEAINFINRTNPVNIYATCVEIFTSIKRDYRKSKIKPILYV